MDGEEFLQRDYPGRCVIIGHESGIKAAVYFLMGRSPSSQARVLEKKDDLVFTKPTDYDVLSKGNPELLLYNALAVDNAVVAVSNGRQTDTIFTEQFCMKGVEDTFSKSLSQWMYEPDDPNFTPRVSGVITGLEEAIAYLGIIKRGPGGKAVREVFEVPPGKFMGIATYTGVNKNPLPSYVGEPFTLDFSVGNAKGMAERVWDLINPDFRVSLVAFLSSEYEDISEFHVINRHEL